MSIRAAIVMGAGGLWLAGLRLFLRSSLSRPRKLTWGACLLLVGIGIGRMLPLDQIWSKFVVVLLLVPLLAAADLGLLRSGRSFSFWIRACGFEVCTVFAAAAAARALFDHLGIGPFVEPRD